MKHSYFYILSLILILASCTNRELDVVVPEPAASENQINASCKGYWIQGGMPVTKALVNNMTTVSLDANFLRIDEETQENSVNYEYDYDDANYEGTTNWEKSYIIEGTVISSPDREGRRSVYLNPVQAYRITTNGTDDDKYIYHHTRIVSWYPKTCELLKDASDKAAITMFNTYKNSVGDDKIYKARDGKVYIKFEDLNGEKDVMVSDMIEAQQYHTDKGTIRCGTGVSPGPHRLPFGYNQDNPAYDNTFQYKHYMSAIRVFGYSEDNSAQVIGMWGRIRKIVVADQPSTCYVALPQTLEGNTNRSVHTPAAEFEGTCNFDIVKTEIFGGDPNSTNPDDHLKAPDNPTLDGYDKNNKLYLGYALVAPGYDLKLDVHTDSGIYRVTIKGSNFKASTIHTLHLKFETTGSIAAIVLDDASGVYYDLTTGEKFNVAGVDQVAYKHANCYVIHSGIKYDSNGDGVGDKFYDGFCFSATKIGNGMQYEGYYPQSVDIAPVKAGLIWEEVEGTITDVTLMYGYVRFKCAAYHEDSRPCNAVVGVFDKYGNVLWSWHIWITNHAPELVKFDLGGGDTLSIMNRNLGSNAFAPDTDPAWDSNAEAAVLGTYGMYYQWGRKDPSMMPASSAYRPMSTETSVWYDAYSFEKDSWDLLTLAQPTMQDAIENPASLILPSSIAVGYKYDWLYNSTSNLWSYSSEGLKTIYDPCPYGYKVPDSEIQALFSAATYVSSITDNGATISNGDNTIRTYLLTSASLGRDVGLYVNQGSKNVFFPFAGFKGVDRGMSSLTCAWKHVGAKGDYMSSSVMSSGHRSRVYLSSATSWTETGADGGSADYSASSHYVLDETNRRTAGSIRCVKDDAFASISIELTPDQDSYVVGDYAQISYQILVNGVKDDLLNKLDISVEYEYEDNRGLPINDKSVDGSLPYGTLKLSNEKTGQFTLTVKEFTSQPKYLKATLVLKNADVVRASKSVLLPVSTWDSYTRYEGRGSSPSGDGIQSGKAIDTVNPFIFTFKNSTSSFLRPHETDPWSLQPVIVDNTEPSSDFLKSCFFYFEDLNNTTAEKSPYKTVASCYFKVIAPESRAVYYLKRTSYPWGYGVSFTADKSEATLIYICSDWNGNTQDYVDLIDSDGNYLYYNSGQKRLQFDGSYRGNLYQWYIHKGNQ